jgi:hypothetical protein
MLKLTKSMQHGVYRIFTKGNLFTFHLLPLVSGENENMNKLGKNTHVITVVSRPLSLCLIILETGRINEKLYLT